MYWWHINNTNNSSLINRVYQAQKINPVKNDWVLQVSQDQKDFHIDLDDNEIKNISKFRFKKKVKNEAKIETLKYLNALKETHSKLDNINNSELECQAYFFDERLNPKEIQLLFSLRTRMFDCKSNFKNQYQNDLWCKLCDIFVDCQSHVLQCPVLRGCVPELRKNQSIKYEDIFLGIDFQVRAIKLLVKVIECRELLLSQKKQVKQTETKLI